MTAHGRIPSFLLLASSAAVVLGVACKNVDEPPPPAAIAGTWLYHESMVDHLYGITCADTGTYTLNQDGAKFTGLFVQSGRCRNGGVVVFNTGHGPVTDGIVTDVKVQFNAGDIAPCSYAGLLARGRASVDAGTGICAFLDSASGENIDLQVTWDMEKQP